MQAAETLACLHGSAGWSEPSLLVYEFSNRYQYLAHSIRVSDILFLDRKSFLSNRIRISEILPWDRKSDLTHAILPRPSRKGYIHWLYWNSHTWSSSDVIVMFK